ncbi:MAG: transposase [Geobacteraceae bacterium]|nr:transposase [Geobacteraceae bacterium]NTW81426.1 transposase [Geobacteraceae bacterium]
MLLARRWIVAFTHSRFNRFRKLLLRYEKLTATYEELITHGSSHYCP